MSKHWEELTSRDGKFNGNNLYRDEKTKKTEGAGGKNLVPNGISLSGEITFISGSRGECP